VHGRHTNRGRVEVVKFRIRNRVKVRNSLKEKIKEDKEAEKIDCGQVKKKKKTLMGVLEHLVEKKEEEVGEVLIMRVIWT
jgi:hypothetical protein